MRGTNIAVVIMAGGRGERFWPSSREDLPKQFLTLGGTKSLLQQTFMRAAKLNPSGGIWVVTRSDYAALIYEQLPELPRSQVLLEPVARDTAACVALASLHVSRIDPEAVMVMLPADHSIARDEVFCETLRCAANIADQSDYLVTLGVRPTRPETAYGYIRIGEPLPLPPAGHVWHVSAFTEKPQYHTAVEYVQEGHFLWNSGMFVWKASTIKKALHKYLPELMHSLRPVDHAIGTSMEREVMNQVYPDVPRISIDYGLMEQAENVVVIEAEFGWDDLGTWMAMERVLPHDDKGNALSGQVLAVNTYSSVVLNTNPRRLVVTLGVSDLVVVDTEDVLLVADKTSTINLKALLEQLHEPELRRFLWTPQSEPFLRRNSGK